MTMATRAKPPGVDRLELPCRFASSDRIGDRNDLGSQSSARSIGAAFGPAGWTNSPNGIWPLQALNFFMADIQAGIGPFLGVFLLAHGWESGMIGTVMTIGGVAGMIMTDAGRRDDRRHHAQARLCHHSRHLHRHRLRRHTCSRRVSGWWPHRRSRPRSRAPRSCLPSPA